MTQPQAATPVPEKPAVRGTGRLIPGPEFLSRAREGGIIYPFLVLFVVLEILDQQSATLIIAAAGTMVLIAGGIDLSVGATYALCQVIAMKLAISGTPPALAIIVGVITGLGVGAVN